MGAAKKASKGTGAVKRRESEQNDPDQQGVSFAKAKRDKERREKKGKKKSSKKEVAAASSGGGSYRTIVQVVRRLAAAAFAVCVFSRGNFGEAFGHGTGINRANLTPVSIVAYAGMNAEFVKGDSQMTIKAKMLSRGLMVPGEAIGKYAPMPKVLKALRPPSISKKYGGQGPNDPLSDKVRAQLDAVLTDKALPKVFAYQNKDILVVGALICILGAIASPLFIAADTLNVIGLAAFYAGTNQCGGRLLPLFWYACGCVFVGHLAGYFDEDTEAPAKRTYRRKKRVAREESSSEDEDEGESAAADDGAEGKGEDADEQEG